ncbi:MAG: aminotransferase class V-fold PLP-dependent enzyme, partial [Planctomycetaceae bacterium]|nr:aminotransferase class V-fold PLP-dependent enzyme [Planctomycetaceae bacterium]
MGFAKTGCSMVDVAALTVAQARLHAIYDPQRFRAAAQEWTDLLSAHMAKVMDREPRVLNWAEPEANIAEAECWLDRSDPRFGEIVQQMLDRGHNLHHPRYIGHQVPAPVPIAGLFDAVGAVTNQVMAIYEMGPWATAVERALVNRLGEQVGWQRDSFAGLVTHGGSLGNLTGLLTARNVTLGGAWEEGLANTAARAVVVVQSDAHYSVARAAGIIGLGTQNVRRAALDVRRKLDPQKLDEQLAELISQGHRVVAVSACACATPIGAFDPLRDIATVCRKHGVWMHVDAAHGGAALFSRRYRHLLDGVDQADSVVWDAHKMMFMPALCAFVLYRDKRHRFETFRQEAPYLFDPSAPGMAEYDSGMLTLECTKRAAAFGLWGTWSLFGPTLFEDLVDVTFELGRVFYDKLAAAEDFVPLHEPECNIVAFRHTPAALQSAPPEILGAFQRELRRRLIESGRFYIVQTNHGGVGALRVT